MHWVNFYAGEKSYFKAKEKALGSHESRRWCAALVE